MISSAKNAPICPACLKSKPLDKAVKNPAAYMSPAPVESEAIMGLGSNKDCLPLSITKDPFLPSLIPALLTNWPNLSADKR